METSSTWVSVRYNHNIEQWKETPITDRTAIQPKELETYGDMATRVVPGYLYTINASGRYTIRLSFWKYQQSARRPSERDYKFLYELHHTHIDHWHDAPAILADYQENFLFYTTLKGL